MQLAAALYVGLTVAITAVAWWLFVPAGMVGVVFPIVAAALLLPFWPIFAELHPERDE